MNSKIITPSTKSSVLWTVFFFFIITAISIAAAFQKVTDPKLLFDLKVGQVITDTLKIPNKDIFTSSGSGHDQTFPEWLRQFTLFQTFSLPEFLGVNDKIKNASWFAVNLLNYLLITLALIIGALSHYKRSLSWEIRGIILALAIAASFPFLNNGHSPLLLLLGSIFLGFILSEKIRLWQLALLPVIGIVWVNTAPLSFLGILLSLTLFGRYFQFTKNSVVKKLAAAGLAFLTVASYIANPFGPQFFISTTPPNFVQPILFTGLLFHAYSAYRFRDYLTPSQAVALALILAAGILNSVFLPIAFLSLGPVVSYYLSINNFSGPRYLANGIGLVTVILLMFIGLLKSEKTPGHFGTGLHSLSFPENAAGKLSALQLHGSVLTDSQDADFFIFRLWPTWKVAYNFRNPETEESYKALLKGDENWESVLIRWNIFAVHFSDYNSPLISRMRNSETWQLVWWDSRSMLFTRSDIELSGTNLSPFRTFKPGLSNKELIEESISKETLHYLWADIRRALQDDPTNDYAIELYKEIEEADKRLKN